MSVLIVQVRGADTVSAVAAAAHELAARAGVPSHAAERATALTEELARAIADGDGGRIILNTHRRSGQPTIEVIGTGRAGNWPAPAVLEAADAEDAYSQPGGGRTVYCRFGPALSNPAAGEPVFGVIDTTLPASQDCWSLQRRNGIVALMLAQSCSPESEDGEAVHRAIAAFELDPLEPIPLLLHRVNSLLRGTSGASVLVASADSTAGTLHMGGLGAIEVFLWQPQHPVQRLRIVEGYAGRAGSRGRDTAVEYHPGALLVLSTTPALTPLEHYPGLLERTPELIAGVLCGAWLSSENTGTVMAVRLG